MKKLVKCKANMKKICSVVGFMWVMCAVQAQGDYVPFPKSNAEWRVAAYNGLKYSEMHGGSLYHPHNTFCYRMEEYDTLIEGVQYSSIMPIYVPPGDYEPEWELGYCAFREENKKVYVYMPGCGEQLLYDFSLKIGDTIFYTIGGIKNIDSGFSYSIDERYSSHYQVLVYIDTIELNTGEKRRRWNLSGGGGNWGGEWIEGIGEIEGVGLFNPFVNDDTWGGDGFTFTCFQHNQESIYSPLCKDCDCREAPTHVTEINQLEISISPNPTSNQLRVTNYELQEMNIEIYDVVGKVVHRHSNDASEIVIDISHLPIGVYFMKISTENSIITKRVIKY